MPFLEWEAAVAAGATLDELLAWDEGRYPKSFKAKVIAWYSNHQMIKNHTEAAVAEASKAAAKKGARKRPRRR